MSFAVAIAVSVTFVIGLRLIWAGAPRRRRPALAARLDPYLRGLVPRESRLLDAATRPLTPYPAFEQLVRPFIDDAARLADRILGGSASVSRRLLAAGRDESVAHFRSEQILWGLGGFLAACLVSVGVPGLLGRRVDALFALAVVAAGVTGGALARDWWLTQEVDRRNARILSELPTVADLLCLAVIAGEGIRAALERITRRAHGELSRELALVLADVRAGAPFTSAMERFAQRVQLPQVSRFVDGIVVAVERGTPLADVLRGQAADVREFHKRRLIEAGGKKEVYMLIPVVFLILPVVVLFALYPGYYSLSIVAR